MLRTRLLLTIFGGVLLLGFPSPSQAQPSDYALVSSEGKITGSDGKKSVSYTVINLTDTDAHPVLAPADSTLTCSPAIPSVELKARRQANLQFSLDNCNFGTQASVGFKLTVGSVEFDVIAKPEAPKPDWSTLWSLVAALLGGLIFVIAGYIWFNRDLPPGLERTRLRKTLPYLSATWSFKDSWATNVTVITAIFTGLFGTSDLVKSITGDAAPSSVALATIGGALGVVLIGVAPVLLQILRDNEGHVLVVGLLLSASIAIGAAGGVVWVVGHVGIRLTKGSAATAVEVAMWIALVLLAAYGVSGTRQNLILGLRPPKVEDPKKADEVVAFLIKLIQENPNNPALADEVRYQIDRQYPTGNSPGDTPSSALL